MNMLNFLYKIRSCIFPKRCPYCDCVIENSKNQCDECVKKFPYKSIEGFTKGGYRCVSSFPYEDIYKNAVANLKFRNRTSVAPQLAAQMTADIKVSYYDKNIDYVTSVPLHKKKQRKRGYNQSYLLAKIIAKEIGVPYIETLTKVKNNKTQHTLKSKERMSNVKNAYKVIDKKSINGKSVLIIDDIITTGHTLGECCRMLYKSGVGDVFCATLCRTM